MKKDLVSVIITNYNYGEYIEQAINSVIEQTYSNIELIIINDGSTDDSEKIIRSIIKKHKKNDIKFITRENKGVVYSRNEGIDVAKGEYICYLDADDFFNKDYVEKSYLIAKKTNVDVVYPNWHFVGEWLGKPDTNFQEFSEKGLQLHDLHCTPASLIKRSAIGSHRFVAEEVAEDWDFFIGLSLSGASFKLAKDNKINYRVRSGTRNSRLGPDEDVKYFVKILNKHKKKYGDRVIDPNILVKKIHEIRYPSTRKKVFAVNNLLILRESIRAHGIKSTGHKIATKTLGRNRLIWKAVSYVRNSRYKQALVSNQITITHDIRLAVIVHLYYVDRWPAIKQHLSRIDVPFDLYVSVQSKDKDIELDNVSHNHKATNIISLPNWGRDVLPFLIILQELSKRPNNYGYILKLHSKKSLHRHDGDEWIEDLLRQMIPVSSRSIIDKLEIESTGMIGPDKHLVSLSRYMGGNRQAMWTALNKITEKKVARSILERPEYYPFFGGTMFWARIDLFKPILSKKVVPSDFNIEKGQVDATTAHALERLFGKALHEIAKKDMYEINKSNIKKVSDKKYTKPYKFAD